MFFHLIVFSFLFFLSLSQHISWTLYRCPQKNFMPEKVQITSGSTLFQTKYYDVNIAGSSGKYTSTLSIKDINPEETGGLYRCDGFPVGTESGVPSSLTTTDYFIIGKKISLQDCFIGPTPRFIIQNETNRSFPDESASSFHQTLGNIIAAAAKDEYREPRLIPNKTFQYILKIPFNKTATQDYKIRFSMNFDGNGSNSEGDIIPQTDKLNKITFNTTGEIEEDVNSRVDNADAIPFNVTDAVTLPSHTKHQYWNGFLGSKNDLQGLEPPELQKSREIPIQNNSYVRFDYTNGEKIQNWASFDRSNGIKSLHHLQNIEHNENVTTEN